MKEESIIDKITGELLECKVTHIKRVKAENFIQVYLEDMASLMRIDKKSYIQVLAWLWKDSSYYDGSKTALPGNKIIINKQLYHVISENTGMTESSIRNTVSNLSKEGFILKDKDFKGTYYLNPKFFFKGKITDKIRACKVSVEYFID